MRVTERGRLEDRLAELTAENEAATGWGAAVGARHEEIKSIQSRLRRLRESEQEVTEMFKQQRQSESTAARVFSVVDLEADIALEVGRGRIKPPALHEATPADFAPPLPLPGYVTHKDGVDDVGKLTAEAVVQQYEHAAKEIETMGSELTERLKKLDLAKAEAMVTLEEIKETAAKYREEGKRAFLQIEDFALTTQEVRSTCNTMRTKIAGPA